MTRTPVSCNGVSDSKTNGSVDDTKGQVRPLQVLWTKLFVLKVCVFTLTFLRAVSVLELTVDALLLQKDGSPAKRKLGHDCFQQK